ncbi:hypothetical protein K227x_62110 [Rubripirellula lacrimiformis]|uniref:Uncharacterized protein n=1 Tax=Rubripirellula lacrimiformis TaxID=1930273 RepID=A0A517NL55_9BACT|nr:hypothetical protein K227x_62110 [Rubripirellula lacrimiformis]
MRSKLSDWAWTHATKISTKPISPFMPYIQMLTLAAVFAAYTQFHRRVLDFGALRLSAYFLTASVATTALDSCWFPGRDARVYHYDHFRLLFALSAVALVVSLHFLFESLSRVPLNDDSVPLDETLGNGE